MKLNKELKFFQCNHLTISLKVKPIDPSLYINRFASLMEFGDQLPVRYNYLLTLMYRLFPSQPFV